ncbi:UvrD-helicase domain-containing protein [Noviherbaspirillum saxi]|nr:UvrD-helicase domain-containing protein [Noviherbaspirillum saxi]
MKQAASSPRAYEANGEAVGTASFTSMACDPMRSVVVEACAGSGKTWLLVARMLRLLLAGAEPAELLAITFTRKAAQEMRERLMQLLHDLALHPADAVSVLLLERGVSEHDLPRLLPMARGLYERVLASPHSLSIDTFHSWFARLVQIAPLSSGVPHGYTLTESTGELMRSAYSRFMQALTDEENEHIKSALMQLYQMVGDWNARRLLDAFVDKRAEWWASTQQSEEAPIEWLRDLCGGDGISDARLSVWEDDKLRARLLNVSWLLGQGAKRNQERAVAIESALTAGASIEGFEQLLMQFCDDKGNPRGNDHRRGKLLTALEAHIGPDGCNVFEEEFAALAETFLQLQRRSCERQVLALNEALFIVGPAYLEHYQAAKAEQRVFDFSDLEWQAYRLLTDNDHAAYLQSRLDARYRHILLDEFQDTNPLQWSIVQAWLNAYGDDEQKPSVFVVGDPKQSIYRFRRAEPRVFTAARDMLATQGASVLRTNQTRRNAAVIVDVLNTGFIGNPIYAPQTTLGAEGGTVWRLPLIRNEAEAPVAAGGFTLRDPLTEAREEEEDARRVDEGSAVARAIQAAMAELAASQERPAKWSDVMLLVKKRSYLSAYESALRAAGIPFVSDKRGGLLESLEVADLIALLSFLITPGDNRAIAHVLKSPIFSASDDDLIVLAQRPEPTWWRRLLAAAPTASQALQRAVLLLEQWLAAAPRLPVHDLLDLIAHQGELIARYAQAAPPIVRAQVLGNIDAFIELALNLDAGRYPSLPKFIEAVRLLRRGAENEAPDEASVDSAVDAVRILTIHSAKGLEAPIVVLVDANHSEPARDDAGILCDWPQHANAPTHFSCFGRKAERGAARDPLFAAEETFKQQEDWNLLYVAATRAKQILIVSGVAGTRGALDDGCYEGSWYHRLQAVPEVVPEVTGSVRAQAASMETEFLLALFEPPTLPGASRPPQQFSNQAIEEGLALHALLERMTSGRDWPLSLPDTRQLARWLRCTPAIAAIVRDQAKCILSHPALERFFNPAHFHAAYNELEIITSDQVMRFDRAVISSDEVWILDYKRDLLDAERAGYQGQLERYRRAAEEVFPGKVLRAALITADGQLWDIEEL